MISLTAKQKELMAYLESRAGDPVGPSFTEIRTSLRWGSNQMVSDRLNALEKRGYIRRLRGRARAIEILRPIINGECFRFIAKREAA